MTTLLHINSNYLVSRLHENLVDSLTHYGINQVVFMPIKKELKREFVYRSHNEVYNPIAFRNVDKYFYSYKQLKIFKKLQETINIDTIDITHAHSLFTDGNIAYKLYKEKDIPFVVTIREFTDMDFFNKRPNLRMRGRKILLAADKIVFLSEKSKDAFYSSYLKSVKEEIKDKVHVIPNGINAFWFENQNTAKMLGDRRTLRLLFVGRIMKSKNIPLILSAMQSLKENNNIDSILTVVGKVKDKTELKKIEKANDYQINFISHLPENKLIDVYRTHDIFIMPSKRESFGLVYAEALSQGLPVIYSKSSGFFKQFEEGYVGFGVDPTSTEDTIEKLKNIIGNYEKISKHAVSAYKLFDWKKIAEEYDSIYKNLEMKKH